MSGRWCVVGGGVLGLATAWRLARQGEQVELYEAAPHLGGLASAWDLGGVRCDRYYHVILPGDRATIGLLEDIGLADTIEWRSVRTGLFSAEGGLSDVSDAAAFLRHAPLRLIDKCRLGVTVGAALARRNGTRLEGVGVEAWLRRWSGGRAFELFWAPLLRSKLGDGYRDASATFIWATLRRLLSARKSGLEDQQVGYLPGGWGPAIDRLAEACIADGVTIRTSMPVRCVRPDRVLGGFDVIDHSWNAARFQQVVVTLAASRSAQLCPDLSAVEHERLVGVRYQGIICVAALLPRPLGGYYLTNITDPAAPITGVVEMTALVDRAELQGHTLVYLPRYVDADHPLFEADDASVTEEFLQYLWEMFPDSRAEPVATAVSRVKEVFAVPTLHYSARMPHITTSLPGLYTVGSAQLPFSPLNVNDTLGLVDELLAAAATPAPALDEGGMMQDAPIASLSIDVDNLWTYQMIHGNPQWQQFGTYLPVVLPRVTAMMDQHGVKLTAFIVGRDAERPENVEAIAALAATGHEIGNHSYRHEPWLHRYGTDELHTELERAEEAIHRCTNTHPTGFRGPGYSLSEDTLRVLGRRGYVYDCSTLPTVIGPLARAYYFRSAELDAAQRAERAHLFGHWREGLRPLGAYRWEVDGRPGLLELPVSTMALVRIPIHVSYLLFLRGISEKLADRYFRTALRLAERRQLDISLLLHPLDVLGPADAEALAFFPGMDLPLATKLDTVHAVLDTLTSRRRVMTLADHAAELAGRELPLVAAAAAGPRAGSGALRRRRVRPMRTRAAHGVRTRHAVASSGVADG